MKKLRTILCSIEGRFLLKFYTFLHRCDRTKNFKEIFFTGGGDIVNVTTLIGTASSNDVEFFRENINIQEYFKVDFTVTDLINLANKFKDAFIKIKTNFEELRYNTESQEFHDLVQDDFPLIYLIPPYKEELFEVVVDEFRAKNKLYFGDDIKLIATTKENIFKLLNWLINKNLSDKVGVITIEQLYYLAEKEQEEILEYLVPAPVRILETGECIIPENNATITHHEFIKTFAINNEEKEIANVFFEQGKNVKPHNVSNCTLIHTEKFVEDIEFSILESQSIEHKNSSEIIGDLNHGISLEFHN